MQSKLTLLFAVLILLVSCRKNRPERGPALSQPLLQITLNTTYMTAQKVDSAVAIWDINGRKETVVLDITAGTLSTRLKNFTPGNGRLTLQVYSNQTIRTNNVQWERSEELEIKVDAGIEWAAPANFEDHTWFPRVILKDPLSAFMAIVALRPADPYFMLKNIPQGFSIELERGYYVLPGGAVSVGGGYWRCPVGCATFNGMIENRTFFQSLPAQINNRTWRMVEIGVGLFSNTAVGPSFYFNHY